MTHLAVRIFVVLGAAHLLLALHDVVFRLGDVALDVVHHVVLQANEALCSRCGHSIDDK